MHMQANSDRSERTAGLRLTHHPVVRFLFVGGLNTLATAAIVVVLSYFIDGWLAFTIAFAIGLAFSVAVTGSWVFGSKLTVARAALFAGAYLLIYLVGVAVVTIVHSAGAPVWVNGASVLLTAPLSFLAGRFIFRSNKPAKG